MTNASIQHFSWSSNTNPPTHIQFRGQPPRLPLQGKTPNIFQQQHVYGSQIPFNVHPVTIQPSMLGSRSGIFGSSSQPASSQANNACRSAQLESGESSHEKIVNISKNKPKNDFPYDLKREFCLFRMNWMSAQSDRHATGICRGRGESFRSALFSFFKSRIPNFEIPKGTATSTTWNEPRGPPRRRPADCAPPPAPTSAATLPAATYPAGT